jgi:hypothetical protein
MTRGNKSKNLKLIFTGFASGDISDYCTLVGPAHQPCALDYIEVHTKK